MLRLEPGDVIVARIDDSVSMKDAELLKEKLGEAFPGHKVLICSGVTLEVARP